MNPQNLIVYCIDVGSPMKGKKGQFGWARIGKTKTLGKPNYSDIESFGDDLNQTMSQGHPIALGFECPLYIPLRENHPRELTKKRDGEGNRSWSVLSGATTLLTGIVEMMWTIAKINKFRKHVYADYRPCLEWSQLDTKEAHPVFFWESLMSGAAKPTTHHGNALRGAKQFITAMKDMPDPEEFHTGPILSLIGSVIVHSRWSKDPNLLHTKTVVIGPPKKKSSKNKEVKDRLRNSKGWFR